MWRIIVHPTVPCYDAATSRRITDKFIVCYTALYLTAYRAKFFAHELTKRCASDSAEKLAEGLVNLLFAGV